MKELELRQELASCWETVCRTTWEQEETGEMIVPDACPDIWQVLDAQTRLLMQRREPQEDKAECSGLLKTTILYQPEGEGAIQTMETTLPFSASPELDRLTRRCMLTVRPQVLDTDVHLLNPRKVLVRVRYQLELEGFSAETLRRTTMVENAESYGVRQKIGSMNRLMTTAVQEKEFSCQETLTLPGGQPDPAALLRAQAVCTCLEAKVIGSKLVFKGETEISLLCRGEDGTLFPAEFRLPYSQILDAGEEGEEALSQVEVLVTEFQCTASEEEPRSFQAEVSLLAQAVLRCPAELPVLADLYSTSYDLQAEARTVSGALLCDHGEDQETIRETLTSDSVPVRLLDVQVRLGKTEQSQDGDDLLLYQKAELSVLYEGEEGVGCVCQNVTVSHRLPGQGEHTARFTCQVLRSPGGEVSGDGITCTLTLRFSWMTLKETEYPVIERVLLGESREETDSRPSVLLRAVHEEETLWDVAKACGSTEGAILAASGLNDGAVYPGQMLLIPKGTA